MKIEKFSFLSKDLNNLIRWIGTCADSSKLNAYVVGGFVRDLLLKRKSIDFDIVVEGDGIKFAQGLAKIKSAQIVKHKQFKTATIIRPNGLKVDIATARREIYKKPAMLPSVMPGEIRDDLFRRDFSINAIALKINKADFGKVLDCFNGLRDIKAKKVRVLHNLSFIDDPTRILRAVRFEQRLNFRLDQATLSLIKEAVQQGMLKKTQPQRIWNEVVLLLKEPNPKRCILRLNEICGLNFIHNKIKIDKSLTESFNHSEKIINWFFEVFSNKKIIDTWLVYFILLVSKLSVKDMYSIVKRYNIRKSEYEKIYSFLKNKNKILKFLSKPNLKGSEIFELLEPLSSEVLVALWAVSSKNIAKKRIEKFLIVYSGIKLYIGGRDLIRLGIKPGAQFKDILKQVLYKRIDGELHKRSEEIKFVKRLIKK